MAELTVPVKIDGFELVEDMAQAVLNWTYKGKTLKEWADSISEPKTNADHIRSMTDEELAEFLDVEYWKLNQRKPDAPVDDETKECLLPDCKGCWLEWMRQEWSETDGRI